MSDTRIVITGLGAVTPVGNSVDEFWKSLAEGKSGITPVTHFDASDLPTKIAGEVKNIDFSEYVDPKEAKRTDRYILLAIAAATEAVEDSGIMDSDIDLERVGTLVSSGVGGLNALESESKKLEAKGPRRVSPFFIPMMIADMAAGMVSIKYGFKGPNYGLVSACASGAHALGDAMVCMKAGMMDACVVGGTEAAITRLGFAGFCSMKAMSTRNDTPEKASSPFDSKRDGFVMGEGAGIVVLETLESAKKRGAKIYGEFVGYGATGDAFHLSSPAPEGEGAARAMKAALSMAKMAPSEIDYINAHGTSTPMNDRNETAAVKAAFGDHAKNLSLSSTKSMTGHLLGGSGGIEFVAAVKAMNENLVPPTINFEDGAEECDLDYTPNVAVKKEIKAVMSNSFGFGGHNCSLVIKEFTE
jgi:3-oxoacyl-[acyl-carrier-protein] synthase II